MNNELLRSKRLILTPIEHSDLHEVHHLHSMPETDRYNTLGIPDNIDVTQAVIKQWVTDNKKEDIKNYTLKIALLDSNKFIGLFGLKLGHKKYKRAEVWYKILPQFWNQGYATETLNAMLDFSFDELKLHRIEAGCAVENIASQKTLEKVGMTKEGRRRQILPLISGWSDNFEFAILSTDFRPIRTNA